MTSGRSPSTSDSRMDTTRAGAQCCAKRPPFTAERRLRTAFIAAISAPLRRSRCVISRRRASGTSGSSNRAAGSAGQQHKDRVLRRQPLRERQRTARRSKGPRIRHRVPGLRQLERRECPAEMAVLGNDNPPPDRHTGTGGLCPWPTPPFPPQGARSCPSAAPLPAPPARAGPAARPQRPRAGLSPHPRASSACISPSFSPV